MSNFFAASLGACLGIGLLLLFYRKCERRLDSSAWSWMFGAFVGGLLYCLAFQVLPGLFTGNGDPSYGLIHVGFSVNPRPVSYTHLDVYKRQVSRSCPCRALSCLSSARNSAAVSGANMP